MTIDPLPFDVSGRPLALRSLDLDRFFSPNVIAVVGASDTEGSASAMNHSMIRAWSERTGTTVVPVNPNRDEVAGERCHPSLTAVPGEVDVAVVLVSAVDDVVRDAIEKKVPFVVVFAAGFAETGAEGEARQQEIAELIAGTDTHVLGPNTPLNAFQPFRREGHGKPIALVTQSGHQGRPLYQAQDLGVSVWGWAPTGNEADLESADFIGYFASRPDVGAVACYIEGFRDGRTLQLALDRAATRRVPVVVVKVGRTEVGRSWAKSHSGHLAGADAVMDAAFRQYGVHRVDTLDELADTSVMLARSQPPVADGVCIYSISGGTGAHTADLAASMGLRLPELGEDTQAKLREWIPSYLRVSNPVDCGGHPAGDERGPKIIRAILGDPEVGVLVVPCAGSFSPLSDHLARDLVEAAKHTDKPICVVWGSPVADEEAYRDVLLPSPLPVFRSVRNCLGAVKAYLDHHAFEYASAFGDAPHEPSVQARGARELLEGRRGALSENTSKQILLAYDIPVTRDVLCLNVAEAVSAAGELGLPVVAKACGAALSHKTEAGAVRVGLGSGREVREAFAELAELGDEGVLVCEQVSDGVEVLVGISEDDLFGPVVTLALGGVAVEVFRDVTFRIPPFDRDEAHRMIRELRSLPLLEGVRGSASADLEALADVLVKLGRMALELDGSIAELDVNPLVVRPDGAVALDALVVAR